MSYITRKIRAVAQRNRQRANYRWLLDRAKRAALARIDPVVVGHVVRRIVDIRNESEVREVVIYDFDSIRSARKKIKALHLL